ncbi:cellular tumor antigen p53 isoform X2 [Halyomorpha halys]|nr:cellular tumor antigen p53-like [Halyomorpha halys]
MASPNEDMFGGFDINSMDYVLPDDINADINTDILDGNFFYVSNIPTKEEYPGPFNFTLTMDAGGQKWVYSQPLQQVFIGMNKVLVLNFRTEMQLPLDEQYYIRALPVYSNNEHINIPVCRCTFHAFEDDPQSQAHHSPDKCRCEEFNNVGHVVRAECRDAIYCFDQHSGRHSVMTPVNRPQPGSDKIAIPYSFACKTSCPGGMQRRAIHLIFTLETSGGSVVGRRILGIKICSCPKRDKERQEKDYYADKFGDAQHKKRPQSSDEQQSKKIKIEHLELIQVPKTPAADGDVKREIKDFKKMFDEYSNDLNNLIAKHSKMLQKMKRIDELLRSPSF